MISRRHLGALGAVLLAIACGEPAAPSFPNLSDGSLHLFGVLAADSATHVVYVSQTDAVPIQHLEGTLHEITAAGDTVPVATATPLSGRGTGFVLLFEAEIRPGRRYRIVVTSPGRPTASVTTTVPGDFSIDSVTATGDPPGTAGLRAVWSPSADAFRYIVNVRAQPDCVTNAPVCEDFGLPWAGVTATARIDTLVPAETLPADRTQAVEVAVYAVNRELFDYFTTGVGGTFTVQPRQNVVGGHGAVGAWVRRTRTISR